MLSWYRYHSCSKWARERNTRPSMSQLVSSKSRKQFETSRTNRPVAYTSNQIRRLAPIGIRFNAVTWLLCNNSRIMRYLTFYTMVYCFPDQYLSTLSSITRPRRLGRVLYWARPARAVRATNDHAGLVDYCSELCGLWCVGSRSNQVTWFAGQYTACQCICQPCHMIA